MKNVWICLVAGLLAVGCSDSGGGTGTTDTNTTDGTNTDVEDDTLIEFDTIDTVDPDTVDPDVVDPDTVDPDVVDPDVVDPDVVDPDVVDPDAVDADVVGPTCAEEPNCECVLTECAAGLGLPAETACGALAEDPCVDELIAIYQAGGCGVACGGISEELWGALCNSETCSNAKGLLAGTGLLTTQCEDCACVPVCDGMECGDDGCGGTCGSCEAGTKCDDEGSCVECTADCEGLVCGDDGCNGSCGECTGTDVCDAGQCVACEPTCLDGGCGDDGCGGSCGTCDEGDSCVEGMCVACTPACDGKVCGADGCGGDCGTCGENTTCSEDGSECTPDNTGNEPPATCDEAHGLPGCCYEGDVYYFENGAINGGPDSCGDTGCGWDADNGWYACGLEGEDPTGAYPLACFGENPAPETCPACSCEGKSCGDDGCGGSCGTCQGGQVCGTQFVCVDPGTLQCIDGQDDCSLADPCMCVSCVPGGGCTFDDDCVCPDCASDSFCGDAANCNGDDICDIFNEGCVCSDCSALPICNP